MARTSQILIHNYSIRLPQLIMKTIEIKRGAEEELMFQKSVL